MKESYENPPPAFLTCPAVASEIPFVGLDSLTWQSTAESAAFSFLLVTK